MKTKLLGVMFLIFIIPLTGSAQPAYKALHDEATVIDMHTDAILRHMRGKTIEDLSNEGHVDLVRLARGGVDVQFFALWPNPMRDPADRMFEATATLLDSMKAIMARNNDRVEFARSSGDIERIVGSGRIAGCLGVEGGVAIEDDLCNLEYFAGQGVLYLGLTWNTSPTWASCAMDEVDANWQGHHGLNAFGKQVIKKMNELGMMIDLSHSGEKTFYDVLETTTKPVIASHSGVYAICPHNRNLKDDQIRALAENGGVLSIIFYPGYLVPGFDTVYEKARKDATAIQDSLKALGSDEPFDRSAYIHRFIDPVYPDISVLADHIQYAVDLVGPDHVGIGSDFDGVSVTPAGLEDVSKMPNITRELVCRGFDDESIKKILGGNILRVLKEVESK